MASHERVSSSNPPKTRNNERAETSVPVGTREPKSPPGDPNSQLPGTADTKTWPPSPAPTTTLDTPRKPKNPGRLRAPTSTTRNRRTAGLEGPGTNQAHAVQVLGRESLGASHERGRTGQQPAVRSYSGGSGIRTHGNRGPTAFQEPRIRPLCHPSRLKRGLTRARATRHPP